MFHPLSQLLKVLLDLFHPLLHLLAHPWGNHVFEYVLYALLYLALDVRRLAGQPTWPQKVWPMMPAPTCEAKAPVAGSRWVWARQESDGSALRAPGRNVPLALLASGS